MQTADLNTVTWRKSSYSNQDGGACVEVSDDFAALVPVRDSKIPHGPVLTFAADGWASFVSAVRNGELGAASWRKSSYSNQDGGACVEVSDDFAALVPVRDSKNPHGPVLTFAADDWASFVSAVRNGELST